MHSIVWAPVAFAFLVQAALTWHLRSAHERDRIRLRVVEQREAQALETLKVLGAASRQSAAAVLGALDAALRARSPSIDTVMVFRQAGAQFEPLLLSGPRAEAFQQVRFPCLGAATPLTQAVAQGHRVSLEPQWRPLIPTDRGALAVPLGRDAQSAVVYVSTAHSRTIENANAIVEVIEQAAEPFELAREREAYRLSARYDALTGLLGSRAFRACLTEEIRVARLRGGPPLCLWFIDTDNFKRVNDTYGHAAGDAALQAIADLVSAHVVAGVDVVARNGGDEFCALIRNVPKSLAILRAQALCNAIAAARCGPAALRESQRPGRVSISVSVGVAGFPVDADDACELLELADGAMYHSKRCGRNRVSFAQNAGFEVFEPLM